jgi:AraC-like DNA-binding protein
MMGGGPQSVVVLDRHILNALPSYRPQETGPYFAQLLTDTKVFPVGQWRGPARLGGVRIGGFSFALIEFGTAMEVEAAVHSDHFLILSCLRGSAQVNLDGKGISVAPGRGFLARPSRHIKARFSSDCVRLAVKIEPHLLAPSVYPDHVTFAVDSEQMKPWFETIRFLFSTPSFIAAGAQDPALLEDMEGILSRLLHRSPLYRAVSQPPGQAASRDVHKAELFVRAHASTTLSLADIASAAAVNVRTLQINFLRYRNMTPMEFVRNVRLDRARGLLMTGNVQVADAASDSGFAHQGRFASRYRLRFGETPSATLKRVAPPKLRNTDRHPGRVRQTANREAL